MTDLSPEARALLDAGREGLSPSAASKAKVLAAVESSIASGSGGASASGFSAAKVLLALALAAGVGGALWLYSGDASTQQEPRAETPMAAATEPLEIAEADPADMDHARELAAPDADPPTAPEIAQDSTEDNAQDSTEDEAEAMEAEAKEAALAEARIVQARLAELRAQDRRKAERAKAPLATDTLLEERKLIAAAQVAIRNKDYVKAHRVLHKHERLFPEGILTQERDAATAIALCLDPDESTGPAAAKQFLQANPSSPLAQRVKRSCQLP